MAFVAAALAGLLLGAANSLSNVVGSPYGPHPWRETGVFPLEVLAAMLGSTWAWALAAFGVGWWVRSRCAPVAGVVALVAADVTYYVCDLLGGISDRFEVESVIVWAVLAVPVGAGMGALGALAAQPRWWSLFPGLSAPVLVAVLHDARGSDHIQPWPAVLTNVLVAVLCVVVVGRWLLLVARRRLTPGAGRR